MRLGSSVMESSTLGILVEAGTTIHECHVCICMRVCGCMYECVRV